MVQVKVNGTALPGGLVSLNRNDELLWSEGTGRSADNGLMSGSVVARKQTVSLQWGVLDRTAYNAIRAAIGAGFFSFRVLIGGQTVVDMTAYRSTITAEFVGEIDGTPYWRGVAVEVVER